MKESAKKLGAFLPALAGLLLAGILFDARGQQAQPRPGTDQQLPGLIFSVEGPDLFRAYCATCHGADGRGTGPLTPALKVKVPDLTHLSANNGGRFPTARVRQTILGDLVVAGHGSRVMPIWGPIFHQVEADMDWGNVRTANLVAYLQKIQSTPAAGTAVSAVPSGAELYKQHCLACHGSDLRGTGPAPEPFRTPPDLTTLARRHGGKFPQAYVADILRSGVALPPHGPADMPIWGAEFSVQRSSKNQVAARITNLSDYIRSRQFK